MHRPAASNLPPPWTLAVRRRVPLPRKIRHRCCVAQDRTPLVDLPASGRRRPRHCGGIRVCSPMTDTLVRRRNRPICESREKLSLVFDGNGSIHCQASLLCEWPPTERASQTFRSEKTRSCGFSSLGKRGPSLPEPRTGGAVKCSFLPASVYFSWIARTISERIDVPELSARRRSRSCNDSGI